MSEIDAFKAPEKQKYNGKRRSGSKSRKNNHEAKTYGFGCHLEAILVSSWGTLEAFGGHFGQLGANLTQHRAVLSELEASLSQHASNMSHHEPTWNLRNPSGWIQKAATDIGEQ